MIKNGKDNITETNVKLLTIGTKQAMTGEVSKVS